jgi:hypothetical protein
MAGFETLSETGQINFSPTGKQAERVRAIRRLLSEIEIELSCRYPQMQDENALHNWYVEVQRLADEMIVAHTGVFEDEAVKTFVTNAIIGQNFGPTTIGLEAYGNETDQQRASKNG